MQLHIKAWGNSQGIRISKDILQEANISIDDVKSVGNSAINTQDLLDILRK